MTLELGLRGLQHLGLPVVDLERSKSFYLELGFKEIMRTDLDGEYQRGAEPVRVAMIQQGGLVIELYQLPLPQRNEIAGRIDGHFDHIALDVADIDQAFAAVKAAGYEILEANAPVFLPFWKNGVKYFTIRGPGGEKVEFNQIL